MTEIRQERFFGGLVHLAVTKTSSGRPEYDCVFMQPGRVKRADGEDSNWLLPAAVVEAAAPRFDSVSSYMNHPLQGFWSRQEPQVEKLIGVTFSPGWSAEDKAVVGGLRLYDAGQYSMAGFAQALFDQMLEDREAGLEVPPIGLSAVIHHRVQFDEESGLWITRDIKKVDSMDVVYSAGAGGYVRAALAAMGPGAARIFQGAWPQGGSEVSRPVVASAPAGGGGTAAPVVAQQQEPVADPLSAGVTPASPVYTGAGVRPSEQGPAAGDAVLAAVERVAAQMEQLTAQLTAPPAAPVAVPGSDLEGRIAALTAQVEQLTAAQAAAVEPSVVQGMGQAPRQMGLQVGLGGLEQVELAVMALLSGQRPPDGVPPLTGIRELYHLLSGDYEMTGMFHGDRVYLANVNSSTMAGLVANALNKVVVNQFQEYPQWWAKAVTPEDFTTLQDVRWITLGGVGELPTVSEGTAYTELTWDDQTETDAFVKKGGYLGITLETIDKDDTRKVVAAPRALAQAAWLTLGKAIAAIFTANSGAGPTMSDSNALFDASNHGNLLTAALSHAAFEAVRVAMMKQTELNSSERLGALTYPWLLWVPIDLQTTAIQVLATGDVPGSPDHNINPFAEGEGREERLRSARERVIVCPFWTDADNWAAQANPLLYPSIGLGFRFGRTPEIFSVASPTAGLMFSNDTMPIKVRFFFAVGPTDWRGLHKNNV